MMAPGFKPVGWVGAVSAAALTCYMLSLNVASERADLARVERQIISTKQDIRALQTELGTRGRLSQLEQWNADVLALSAPTTAQFLDNEVKLARFDQRAPTMDERVKVQMAAVEVAPVPDQKVAVPVVQAAAPVPVQAPAHALVRKASFQLPAQPAEPRVTARAVSPDRPQSVQSAPAKASAAPAAGAHANSVQAKPAAPKPAVAKTASPQPTAPLRDKLKAPAPARTALASARDTAPAKAASPKKSGRLDDKLIAEIRTAAKAEAGATHR